MNSWNSWNSGKSNLSGMNGLVSRSFPGTCKTHASRVGRLGELQYGDRIFVRVQREGRIELEFETAQVSDYTEVLGEIRRACRHISGLVRLYVRNVSRGWSKTVPFMLYGSSVPVRRRAASVITSVAALPAARDSRATVAAPPRTQRQAARHYVPESIYLRYGQH